MMKHTFKIKSMLFLLIILMLLSPVCMATNTTSISATNTGLNNTVTTDNSVDGTYDMIASDVYEFNQDVTIDSIVNGNAFAFGNNVTVTGEIGGDIFAFGNKVTIAENAYIHGSIFVFANQFTMNGVCYDIYSSSANFTLGEKAIVARDIRVTADKIHINGQIKRNAFISASELIFPENATGLISGNLSYSAPSELTIDNNVVKGNIKYTPQASSETSVANKIASYINTVLSALLYSLAVVLLTIWLAPNFKNKASVILKKKAPVSLGIGILASIIIVVAAFALLFITNGLGFGISVAVVTIFILALTISQTVFAMGCSKFIAEKVKKDNLPMFIGFTLLVILVLRLIGLIPFVGALVGFLVTMTGFGMILVHLMRKSEVVENDTAVTE